MQITTYNQNDYDDVKSLLGHIFDLPNKDRLGGAGVVARKEGKVIGFNWALISPDSDVAYINYFYVDEKYREGGTGHALMFSLFFLLKTLQKKMVYGTLCDDKFANRLASLYQHHSMQISKAKYLVNGNVDEVLERLSHGIKNNSQE